MQCVPSISKELSALVNAEDEIDISARAIGLIEYAFVMGLSRP